MSQQQMLNRLTDRERQVLALLAQGRSNAGIAEALVVSEAAVAKHINSIFTKLDLLPAGDVNRRVLAVLRFLRSQAELTTSTGLATAERPSQP